MKKTPLWFRIAKDYPGFNIGPTIPFIMGAVRLLDAKASAEIGKEDVRSFMLAMEQGTPSGYGIAITWCPALQAPVVDVRMGGAGLAFESLYDYRTDDSDAFVEAFWAKHGDDIRNERFSRQKDGSSRRFEEDELTKIGTFRDA